MERLKHEISINTNLEKIQRKKSTIEAIDTCEKMSESLLNSKEQETSWGGTGPSSAQAGIRL